MRYVLVSLVVAALVFAGLWFTMPSVDAQVVAGKCEVRVRINGNERWLEKPLEFCGVTATPTAVSTPTVVAPTPTMSMPMPTEVPTTSGWHAPTDHEHGDAPPAWVINSGHAPFTQTRESHTGYKGVYDVSPGGAESYLITHILTTVMARSHGDHDYQMWLRNPATGEVLYVDGVLDFGNPPVLRTVDTGERPIILGERNATDGCETWYSRPGKNLMDIGWTTCDRYQKFDGTILGGTGAFRTADWIIPCDRLPANSTLRNNCVTEFGISRLSFLSDSKNFFVPGIVPIN